MPQAQSTNGQATLVLSTSAKHYAPYKEFLEQHAIDAAFLWLLRSKAAYRSDVYPWHIKDFDRRITAHLDGLCLNIEIGWQLCKEQLEIEEAGEVFAAAVVAFRSGDSEKIKFICELAKDNTENRKAVVSAMGWLPEDLCWSWTSRFLKANNSVYQYYALAVCSIRRLDIGQHLTDILLQADIAERVDVHSRALRLIGELQRRDLLQHLLDAMQSEHESVRFWSCWSAVLLGQQQAIKGLKLLAIEPTPYRQRAMQLIQRALPVEDGRDWVAQLLKNTQDWRLAIEAVAMSGDPHTIKWLLDKVQESEYSRLAAWAFTRITGIDIEQQSLIAESLNKIDEAEEAEDPDEDLPWPDSDKLQHCWRLNKSRFEVGSRYIAGCQLSHDNLPSQQLSMSQYDRQLAVLDMALLPSQVTMPLINIMQYHHDIA